jgi:hypothetical protein
MSIGDQDGLAVGDELRGGRLGLGIRFPLLDGGLVR